MTRPTVLIHCGGGLGNRFGGIVGGLHAAQALDFDPIIHWRPAHQCGARLQDLFAHIPLPVIDDPVLPDWPWVSHKPREGHKTFLIESVPDMKCSFIYASHRWLHDGRDVVQRFVVRPEIQAHADAFCAQHGIDRSWTGIHVRGTDVPNDRRRQDAWELAKQAEKAFLCSDEPKIEAMFAKMKNVVLHPKSHPIRKANPNLPWRLKKPARLAKHRTKYNVDRHLESVIEALQDALILSRTSISCRRSTFCDLAKAFSPEGSP